MNNVTIYGFIKQVAILYPTFILLFTVRGFFQAWSARLVGDDTPQENGFLTLNPLAHIDVLGSLLFAFLFASIDYVQQGSRGGVLGMLFLLVIIFSGIRPYYPVYPDSRNFKWQRLGVLVTTLATTFSYLFLTLISMYALVWGHQWLGGLSGAFLILQQVTGSVIEWAMFWVVISLIPVPPFDAAALLPVIFGDIGQDVHDFLEPYGIFIFFALLFIPGVSDWFLAVIGAFRALIYQGLISLVYLP
jgi:hypothetical protein